MNKKQIPYIIVFFLSIFVVTAVSIYEYNDPLTRSIADYYYCQLTGCNITGDVYMNGNTLYNVTIEGATIFNATQSVDWGSLINIPAGFDDDIDNDTQYSLLSEFTDDIGATNHTVYTHLSNFTNDPGYITDGNDGWDNSYGLAYLLNITWYNLLNIPSGFSDDIDNDTQYSNLSEFINDVGYVDYSNLNWSLLNNLPPTFADNVDNDTLYSHLSNFTNDLTNITGNQIDGYDWWTNVATIDESDAYFNWNVSNGTLELWVNGELQQDWGASTTIYQEATFLDAIFGDGSTLYNICLANGSTLNGAECNATSIFDVDEIYINNIGGNATFNESKLNSTIINLVGINGFSGYFVNLDFTNTTGFNDFVDNDTDYCKDGNCLGDLNVSNIYVTNIQASTINVTNLTASWIEAINILAQSVEAINMTADRLSTSVLFADDFFVNGSVTGLCQTNGTGCPNKTIDTRLTLVNPYLYDNGTHGFFNETYLNLTIGTLSEVQSFEEDVTINVVSGYGSALSSEVIDFEITRLTVYPASNSTNYRFEAIEQATSEIIDKDRRSHKGVWDIRKSHAINNEYVNVTISSAITDGVYIARITYLDNYN